MNIRHTDTTPAAVGRRTFLRGTASVALAMSAGGGLTAALSACGSTPAGGSGTSPGNVTPSGAAAASQTSAESGANASGTIASSKGASGSSIAPKTDSPVHQVFTTPFGIIPSFLATYVANQEGFWSKRGLDVDIQGANGTAQSTQSVINGSAQYFRGGASGLIPIVTQNAPFRYFLQEYRTGGFVISSIEKISSPKDLAGKTVGIVSVGGTTQTLLQVLLNESGIPPKSVPMPVVGAGTAPYQLCKSGKVDAWVSNYQDPALLRSQGYKVYTLDPTDFISFPGDSYACTVTLLQQHRDQVVAFAAGLLEAYLFCSDKANWPKAIKDAQHFNPKLSNDSLESALRDVFPELWLKNGRKELGVIEPGEWEKAQEEMKRLGLIKQLKPVDQIVDASIVPDANKLL